MIRFKNPLQKVQKIKVEVDYPEGASPAFTVREISFYKKAESTLNRQLLKVFRDTSCSSINPRCTLADLKALPEFLPLVDEVVIARGDLGNAMPLQGLQPSGVCRQGEKYQRPEQI